MLQSQDVVERRGPWRVSLEALLDLGMLVLVVLGCGLALFLLLAMANAAWKLGGLPTAPAGAAPPWLDWLLALAILALPLAWIVRQPTPAGGYRFSGWPAASTLGVAAGVLAAAAFYPLQWLADATGNDLVPSNAVELEQLLLESWWVGLLLIVVIAPVIEEIVFRKFLLTRFLKFGYPLLGVAVTSLLFGLMHEPFPGGEQSVAGWALLLIGYSVMGALFAAAYCLTGRLSAAILAHAANNLIASIVYWSSL